MTDSGSGRPDDPRGGPHADSPGSNDDYNPSASWGTNPGGSWDDTTAYESPYAAPGSHASAAE
ncbi:MAG: hypothetical protein L0H26_04125, partial [Microlunatus sp.]|nr:hypothetical protein [Microlunatus sp.]